MSLHQDFSPPSNIAHMLVSRAMGKDEKQNKNENESDNESQSEGE